MQFKPVLNILLFLDIGDLRNFLLQNRLQQRLDVLRLAHHFAEDEIIGQRKLRRSFVHGVHLLSVIIIPESDLKSNCFRLLIAALRRGNVIFFHLRLYQPGDKVLLLNLMPLEVGFQPLIGFLGHLNGHCSCVFHSDFLLVYLFFVCAILIECAILSSARRRIYEYYQRDFHPAQCIYSVHFWGKTTGPNEKNLQKSFGDFVKRVVFPLLRS